MIPKRHPWVCIILTWMTACQVSHALLPSPLQQTTNVLSPLKAMSEREMEIRRKIRELKRNKANDDDDDDDMADYAAKVRQKLGSAKSRLLLGLSNPNDEIDDDDDEDTVPLGQLGALPVVEESVDTTRSAYTPPKNDGGGDTSIAIATDDDDNGGQLADDALVELVAQRLQQTPQKKEVMVTSGIGGSWQSSTKDKAQEDVYQPKSGSWGAFPRPRDISKAYGGGRRVGPGYSNEQARAESMEKTRRKLQEYRKTSGIEVASEKENAPAIEEAQSIASLAMQRGMYATAVSALEKVTQFCSTNSKVGGKVFLELAMAYEAIGRTDEAVTVYQTLTRSRLDETRNNAKRLLYGLEAMRFMRDNVSSSEFSRSRAKTTFIDTTGLGNIASKFDDVYETAYVDLDSNFYKKLTESVVRGHREARQILLKASGPGEVERRRIVQALRSVSRAFADALEKEIEANTVPEEPVAVIDGRPIMPTKRPTKQVPQGNPGDEFVLMEAEQMLKNLNGEWRLQLIADKQGDGVKFFNNTNAWQVVNTDNMDFNSLCPQGFFNVEQTGDLRFNPKRRILRRGSVSASGAIFLSDMLVSSKLGAVGAVRVERQVMVADSLLLITRGVPRRRNNSNNEKDYFAVWRRVEPGTFSEQR